MKYFYITLLMFSISLLGNTLDSPATDNFNYGRNHKDPSSHKQCMKLYNKNIVYYKKLFKYLSNSDKKLLNNDISSFIVSKSKKHCHDQEFRKAVKTILSRHSGKLGVILPLSGNDKDLGAIFSESIHSFLKGRTSNLIEYDSNGKSKNFHRQLAKLVFKEKVSILMGGATKQEANRLSLWSDKLKIPTLIFHHPPSERKSKYAFYISPSQTQMAKTLAAYIGNRAWASLAIFSPDEKNQEFLEELTKRLGSNEFRSIKVVNYQLENYESLEVEIKDLFRITDPEREEELAALIEEKRQVAEKAGLPFEPSRVMLPPQETVDAIVVLDDFKTLRHFVNILKYLKVPPLPLLGAQSWRAPEIFTPPEPYFIGALFVDYIGSYKKLPYELKVTSSEEDPLFTTPEESINLDFLLIGKHAVDISDRVFSNLPRDRRKIIKILREMKTRKDSPFFKSKLVFDRNQISNWPTFLFSITHKNLFQAFYRPAEEAHLKRSPIANQKL